MTKKLLATCAVAMLLGCFSNAFAHYGYDGYGYYGYDGRAHYDTRCCGVRLMHDPYSKFNNYYYRCDGYPEQRFLPPSP